MERKGYLDVTAVVSGNDKDKRASKLWGVLNPAGQGGASLDLYDSEYFATTGSMRSSIPLKSCRRIEVSKSIQHTFELTCSTGAYRFGCSSREEMDGWIEDVRRATGQAKPSGSSDSPSNVRADVGGSSGTFSVTLKQNQVAKRLKFTGVYNLRITIKNISLYEEESDVRVATWTYDQLRKFTSYKSRIEIETGRRSETGPGVYIFMTPRSDEISQLITSNIRRIDEKIKRMNAAASGKDNGRVLPDPFENPCYDNHIIGSSAALSEKAKDKVPRDPFENPCYSDNPYLINTPTAHPALDGTAAVNLPDRGKNHDYEEVEFLQPPAPRQIKADRLYATVGELVVPTASTEEHDGAVVDYIPMQEASTNALALTGSRGSTSNASPRLLNEKIYAKVTKPPKTSAGTQLVAQGSPSGKAAPEKRVANLVGSLIGWDDFDDDQEYVAMKPNISYVKASHTVVPAQLHKELSHLEVSTGGVDSHVDEKLAATAPAPALHAPDNPSAALGLDGEYAGHLQEIDRMWNETWNM